MRFGIAYPHPVTRKSTTHGGLLQISSVQEHEQIADGHPLGHDSRILGFQFMHYSPSKVRLQVN